MVWNCRLLLRSHAFFALSKKKNGGEIVFLARLHGIIISVHEDVVRKVDEV